MTHVAVALAGGFGAVLRVIVDGVLRRGRPVAAGPTVVVNVTGSLVLGLVTGLAGHGLGTDTRAVLGTGLCGGYTTFSAASWEVAARLAAGRRAAAVLVALGMLIASVAAAAAGWVVADHA